MSAPLLSIFARFPVPGQVKTRLIPALGAQGAAALYDRLVRITLAAAQASGLAYEVRVTGAPAADFAARFGTARVTDQGEGDLGERLARVAAPGIVIGSDAPALSAERLRQAADALHDHRAVIGPALDGGYYLLGFREPAPFAFAAMRWSSSGVCDETVRRFRAEGIEPMLLDPLGDIDTPEDLTRHPELAR